MGNARANHEANLEQAWHTDMNVDAEQSLNVFGGRRSERGKREGALARNARKE